MIASGGCRLYLVTPPALDLRAFPDLLARTLDAGDVAALQLRLKDTAEDTVRRAIDALRPVAQSRDVAFLLNDDPELAAVTGCDGAHIGPQDTPPAAARRVLRDGTLGVSCGASRDAAMRAGEDGADYVAFGAFFPSRTKPGAPLAEPDIIAWWATLMELPCVAIGGITPENCAALVQAGADFIAAVGAVWQHPDGPAAGVRAMSAAIAAAQPA
jgi:thiamine-phosphate pyrophosphorylase